MPRELTLISNEGKLYLHTNPVAELSKYKTEKISAGDTAELLEIYTSASTGEGKSTKIRVAGDDGKFFEFGYDAESHSIFVDRTMAWNEIASSHIHSTPVSKDLKTIEMRAIVDRSSVEIFAADGRYVISDLLFLPGANRQVSFEISQGCQPPRSLEVHRLAPPQ